jgi:uncharacterized protein YndB with AHSA1/START domain
MPKEDAIECTLILKRIYNASIARVWRAWTSADELGKWYVAGSDHIVHFAEADVRIGGTYRVGFEPPGTTPYIETGRYTEIVPMKRLAFAESVSLNGAVMQGTSNIVELRDLGNGKTELVLTCAGENSWRSGEGWTPCLQSLAAYLDRSVCVS